MTYQSKSATHRLPLPPYPPTELKRCITLSLPDDPAWLALFWGNLARLGQQTFYERDEQHTARLVARVFFDAALAATSGNCVSEVKVSKNNFGDVEIGIEDCMGNIIIYNNGCGCEGEGGNVSQLGKDTPKTSAQGNIDSLVSDANGGSVVTPCDAISAGGMADYVIDQSKEWLIAIQNAATGGTVVSVLRAVANLSGVGIAIDQIWSEWAGIVDDLGIQPAVDLMDDSQFQNAYKKAWLAQAGSTRGKQPTVTRDFLLGVAKRLGFASFQTGAVSLPSVTMRALTNLYDYNDLNLSAIGIQGTANNELCQQLAEQAGVVYTPSVLASGSESSGGDVIVTGALFDYINVSATWPKFGNQGADVSLISSSHPRLIGVACRAGGGNGQNAQLTSGTILEPTGEWWINLSTGSPQLLYYMCSDFTQFNSSVPSDMVASGVVTDAPTITTGFPTPPTAATARTRGMYVNQFNVDAGSNLVVYQLILILEKE